MGFWRSVGHSHNAFMSESFVDEWPQKPPGWTGWPWRRKLLRLASHGTWRCSSWRQPRPGGAARP